MPKYDSPSAAHAPTHGGYPGHTCTPPATEPTMAECAERLGFASVEAMMFWVQVSA